MVAELAQWRFAVAQNASTIWGEKQRKQRKLQIMQSIDRMTRMTHLHGQSLFPIARSPQKTPCQRGSNQRVRHSLVEAESEKDPDDEKQEEEEEQQDPPGERGLDHQIVALRTGVVPLTPGIGEVGAQPEECFINAGKWPDEIFTNKIRTSSVEVRSSSVHGTELNDEGWGFETTCCRIFSSVFANYSAVYLQ